MMKFAILLAFFCFQFSLQEELTETENINNELISDEIPQPSSGILSKEILDGADEEQWYKGKDKSTDYEWTEEDEKWLQEIQGLLEDSDEDYDEDLSEAEKLIEEIEAWIKNAHPEKKNYKWLLQIENWFDKVDYDSDYSLYPDIVKKEENVGLTVDKNNNLGLYYSWLYRMKLRNSDSENAPPVKRFSSV